MARRVAPLLPNATSRGTPTVAVRATALPRFVPSRQPANRIAARDGECPAPFRALMVFNE